MVGRARVHIGRRQLLGGVGAVALLAVAVAAGDGYGGAGIWQPSRPKVQRLGILRNNPNEPPAYLQQLREGMREHGYVEGESFIVDVRTADAQEPMLRELASELMRLPADVIVASGSAAAAAAKNATTTVPIVMVGVPDPVGTGLVPSLARPDGNLTGLTANFPQQGGKQLELLHEAVPGMSRVGVFWNPPVLVHASMVQEIERVAPLLGIEVVPYPVSAPGDLPHALDAVANVAADSMLVLGSPLNQSLRAQYVEFAARTRLPAMYGLSSFVRDGGLMSYGTDVSAQYRRAGYYVARILGGTPPANLPIEQPTRFELVLNLRTAQTLGLNLPTSLLLDVTDIVQ